ncbi:MAG: hypothetical protein WCH86_04810 [Kiritimatiellales bacterium]
MRKNAYRLFFVLIAGAVLLTSPVFADLGLAQLAAQPQGGARAVGQAVLTAAKAVYANSTDPAVIQPQLIAILNEAAATGDESAIRYAIVAVILAGGVDNLPLSKTAINDSNVFVNYPKLTAVTVSASEALLKASGGAGGEKSGGDKALGGGDKGGADKGGADKGGGDKGGGDKSGGEKSGGDKQLGGGDKTLGGGDKELGGGNKELGGGNKELGGGDPTWFPFWDSFPTDNDVPATRI